MNNIPSKHWLLVASVFLISSMGLVVVQAADAIAQGVNTHVGMQKDNIRSQQRIDALSEAARKLLEDYQFTERKVGLQKQYNAHLQTLVDDQAQTIAELEQQISQIETTKTEIVPLMLRMFESLEQFVALDLPFLGLERQERLLNLQEAINSAEHSLPEKFRRLLEAFQIESDYGRTIEAYEETLNLDGVEKTVNVLRIGRISLLFQTLDGTQNGYWNREAKAWQPLDKSYRLAIKRGLAIARKQAAPDLITIPVPTAEKEG